METVKPRSPFATYWILLALGVLFLGPIIAALSFYEAGNNWHPSTLNHGYLIREPLNINQLNITMLGGKALSRDDYFGKWTMLFIEPQPNTCDKICQRALYSMRQVRLALGKDMERVQRLVATYSATPSKELNKLISKYYVGTKEITIDSAKVQQYAKYMLEDGKLHAEGVLLIVDPLGNVMMSYQPNVDAEGVYSDLNRLLSVSHIG